MTTTRLFNEPDKPVICPLCHAVDCAFYHQDKQRKYLCCPQCQLVFVPSQYHLSEQKEKSQYDLHQNDPGDEGYRKFLSRVTAPLLAKLQPGSCGLDFGCGPGPTLSVMLEEEGHFVTLYDIFYANYPECLCQTYDFVTATEVVEHLSEPGVVLNQLWNLVKPGGCLAIMTKMVSSQTAFETWHYKMDPTHICFFPREAFIFLGRQWNCEPQFIGSDVVFFEG